MFNFAHEFLWQGLIMLDVLIVWLLWVRAGAKAQKIGEPPRHQKNHQCYRDGLQNPRWNVFVGR